MKILVDRIAETPDTLRFEADPGWWEAAQAALPELREQSADRFTFEVAVHRMGEDLYLEGTARGELSLGCSRCLTRYRHPLHEPFRLVLAPAGDGTTAEPEARVALERDGVAVSDELESGWYHGSELDLTAIFRELVALGLPVQPLCREDCRGLCPRCGIDRNLENCDCPERPSHSPFAVLSQLRVESSRGEN